MERHEVVLAPSVIASMASITSKDDARRVRRRLEALAFAPHMGMVYDPAYDSARPPQHNAAPVLSPAFHRLSSSFPSWKVRWNVAGKLWEAGGTDAGRMFVFLDERGLLARRLGVGPSEGIARTGVLVEHIRRISHR